MSLGSRKIKYIGICNKSIENNEREKKIGFYIGIVSSAIKLNFLAQTRLFMIAKHEKMSTLSDVCMLPKHGE